MKERYWSMMTNKKFGLIYLGLHMHKSIVIERSINICLAVISTGSLGGLFLWERFNIVWATILVLTQVITAIKPYLPFAIRTQEIEKMIIELNLIYNEIEAKWLAVANEELSDSEINKLYYQLVSKWDKVDSKYLLNDSLPQKKKLINQANEEKELYFQNTFGGYEDEQ